MLLVHIALSAAGNGLILVPFAFWLYCHCLFLVYVASETGAPVRSWLLQRLASNTYALASNRKYSVSHVPMDLPRPTENHTHGESANHRSRAVSFGLRLAANLGIRPFFNQMSLSQQRKQLAGNRDFFWTKDMGAQARYAKPGPDDLRIYIDTDYYQDMPSMMARPGNYAIYTFAPTQAARGSQDDGDYAFRFLEDQSVEYSVSGTAKYSHKVWNFNHDELTASYYGFDRYISGPIMKWLGVATRTTAYLVERRQFDENHSLVCTFPVASGRWLTAALLSYLDSTPIKRFEPVVDGFTVIKTTTTSGLDVSIAKVGPAHYARLDTKGDVLSEALIKATLSGRCTAPMMDATFRKRDGDYLATDASPEILALFARSQTGVGEWSARGTDKAVQYVGAKYPYDPDVQPAMQAFMQPLYDGNSFHYATTRGNELTSVRERVTKVRSDKVMSRQTSDWASEFVRLLGKQNSLVPASYDDVREKQSRPTQRAILDAAAHLDLESKEPLRTFLKRESGTLNHPRTITPVPGRFKLEWSRFTYALSTSLKTAGKSDLVGGTSWYASGMKPRSIAERVAFICSRAKTHVVISDFSRMDGRVSPACRELEKRIVKHLFHPSYHAEIDRLMDLMVGRTAITRTGIHYDTGTSRSSGSPETSVLNSLIAAFIVYIAIRSTYTTWSPEEAFDFIGAILGDDGLTADINPEALEKAASWMGQLLTSEVVDKGQPGVNFLARYYTPNVWWGAPDSTCDIVRQISKFHLTVHLPEGVTPRDKLAEKVRSYLATDRNTPILGEFLAAAAVLLDGYEPSLAEAHAYQIQNWWAQFDLEDQFPNEVGDAAYGVPQDFDFGRFSFYLENATEDGDLDALLKLPPFGAEPPPKAKPCDLLVQIGEELPIPSAPPLSDDEGSVEEEIATPVPLPKKKTRRGRRGGKRNGRKKTNHTRDKNAGKKRTNQTKDKHPVIRDSDPKGGKAEESRRGTAKEDHPGRPSSDRAGADGGGRDSLPGDVDSRT